MTTEYLQVECRRTLILRHFGELFDRADCQGSCDNCKAGQSTVSVDCTAAGAAICQAVSNSETIILNTHRLSVAIVSQVSARDGACTLKQLALAYAGSSQKATEKQVRHALT
jgi:bloom syndrome protein